MLIQAMEHQKEKQPEGEQAVKIGDGIEQNARKERPIYDGNIGDDSPLRDGDQYASDGYARLLGCKSDSEGNGGANGDADGHADAAGDGAKHSDETSADADGLHSEGNGGANGDADGHADAAGDGNETSADADGLHSEGNGGANGDADGHADAAGDGAKHSNGNSADADGLHSEGNGGANGDADGDADAEDEWKALTAKEIANMDLHHCRKHLAASQCPHDYIMCKDEDPTCLVRSILQLATS